MASAKVLEQPRPTVTAMSRQDFARVLAVGLMLGVATYCLYIIFDRYVFSPTLCSEAGLLERCDNKESYAATMAMLVGGFGGLLAMVKLRVYRPLLVAILATAALWGILELGTTLPWWVNALAITTLFGTAYVAFAWLVRIRSFYLALGLSAVLVIVVRLILSA